MPGGLGLLRQRHGATRGRPRPAFRNRRACRRRWRALEQLGAHLRRAGIEEDRVVGIGERRVEIGRPARDVVLLGEPLDLLAIAADEDRVGHQPVAVAEDDAALVADREDRADQVLVVAHAAGDAVHDQPQPPLGHRYPPCPRLCNCLVTWIHAG